MNQVEKSQKGGAGGVHPKVRVLRKPALSELCEHSRHPRKLSAVLERVQLNIPGAFRFGSQVSGCVCVVRSHGKNLHRRRGNISP